MSALLSARAYREAEILAATPARLVVITYDGLLSSLLRARAGVMAGNLEVIVPALDRSRGFLGELLGTLNHEAGGDLAARLSSIYVFMLRELQTLVQDPDLKRLDATIALVGELRDAFVTISVVPRAAVA